MPTLAICVKDTISVQDMFGELSLVIRRWAISLFAKEEAVDEDEPHEPDDSPESGTDPPALEVNVEDSVNANDVWGGRR